MLNANLKKLKYKFKSWFFPSTNAEIEREIDGNNLKNVFYLCLVVSVIQLCSLIVYFIVNFAKNRGAGNLDSVVNVSLSIVICVIASVTARIIIKKQEAKPLPRGVTIAFLSAVIIILTLWGYIVSIRHYINSQQMLTFYTVELCIMLFVKLRPIVSISLFTISAVPFYIYLNFFVKPGLLNPYNYAVLFLLITASAVHSYSHTIKNIKQRNRIELLNNSLQIIADHDRLTRLNNRYALERRIPEFLDKDICVAMLDINKFKSINDTYGHPFGDAVLKLVADRMLEVFPRNNIFRYGGDEFLAIEFNTSMDKFLKKFKRLNKSLENSHIGEHEISIRCCYGCVEANVSEPKAFMDIIAVADKKLYIEKERTV